MTVSTLNEPVTPAFIALSKEPQEMGEGLYSPVWHTRLAILALVESTGRRGPKAARGGQPAFTTAQ